MIDTRRGIRKFADVDVPESRKDRLTRFALSLLLALLIAYVPAITTFLLPAAYK